MTFQQMLKITVDYLHCDSNIGIVQNANYTSSNSFIGNKCMEH